jgi:hypothetical protein
MNPIQKQRRNLILGGGAVILGGTAVLTGCGGGGVEVGSGGTGNTTPNPQAITVTGPITGFGSIIINSIRFDDTNATVADERGALFAKDRLRLGMVVTVSGQVQSDGVTAVATAVQLRSELKGNISAIDLTNNKITVLGFGVMVTNNTSFDDVASITALRINDVVQVYGLRDPISQIITATRIERDSANSTAAFVVGNIRSIDSINKTLVIGSSERSITLGYGNAVITPASNVFALDQKIYAEVSINSNGLLQALNINILGTATAPIGGRVDIEGVVSEFTSLASFKISGQQIDASAAEFNRGSLADLKNGAIAAIRGELFNGIIKASRIEIQTNNQDANRYQLKGSISSFTSVSQFVVRNTVVDATNATYLEGNASLLAVNAKVELTGVIKGNVLQASTIKIER